MDDVEKARQIIDDNAEHDDGRLANRFCFYLVSLFSFAVVISFHCMALSHKDWEIPNSRIWLAERDIDRGIDIPI